MSLSSNSDCSFLSFSSRLQSPCVVAFLRLLRWPPTRWRLWRQKIIHTYVKTGCSTAWSLGIIRFREMLKYIKFVRLITTARLHITIRMSLQPRYYAVTVLTVTTTVIPKGKVYQKYQNFELFISFRSQTNLDLQKVIIDVLFGPPESFAT